MRELDAEDDDYVGIDVDARAERVLFLLRGKGIKQRLRIG